MKSRKPAIADANEAVASVAYRLSETIAIFPITPSSPMAELSDEWASASRVNLWNTVPRVVQMQSEAGVAGAVHGAVQGGSLTTTFTASQGLLLMIPNMYKIAGELSSFCMHVTARSLATHALSIFGDHSDVMACRQTGFALLASNTVQEAQDLAVISHAATLRSRVPFLHFFDGFRTSHEINAYEPVSDEVLDQMVAAADIRGHRERALTPDRPSVRGTAQNPDVFFQAREAANPFYDNLPGTVQATMDAFAQLTGRQYHNVEYVGAEDAEHVVVIMGSGAETVQETSAYLNARGAKTGVLKVRLYRPFPTDTFLAALPATAKTITVLDRTKEPGAIGDPLYLDVVAALNVRRQRANRLVIPEVQVLGGRYGLGSKEFDPAMAKGVFENALKVEPLDHFSVGINDDVTFRSIPYDPDFTLDDPDIFEAVFIGLGSDGTVGANKNTIKIIGENTDNFAQAYFVYDSKKSGAMTFSHLRFGPKPISAPYLIRNAQFVGCHQAQFLEKNDILQYAGQGAVLLLNSMQRPDKLWDTLPSDAQAAIIEKDLRVFTIDAYKVAHEAGMGGRINTIMQTCFFAISGVIPKDDAIRYIKAAIKKTYGRKGESIVQKNYDAVDQAIANLHGVDIPDGVAPESVIPAIVPPNAPDFVKRVTAMMLAGKGDLLPVSAFPVDGVWPSGTSKWEKRSIAKEIPVWDADLCIQCGKCSLVCPHAAIRAKAYPADALDGEVPDGFVSTLFKSRGVDGQRFTIQTAPDDCTGCTLCVSVCPAKDKKNAEHKAINMEPLAPILEQERAAFDFFLQLPEPSDALTENTVKGSQLRTPLFEFSGACAGCGETPYVKLITQLFGDRMMIANATGCSSIFGGNLPTTPYTVDAAGRGPAWSNSLFEDNAEFALGMRLAVDSLADNAVSLLWEVSDQVGVELAESIASAVQENEEEIRLQRQQVMELRERLAAIDSEPAKRLAHMADYLVRKSIWAVGGDGWAYDIGFGGLDHILASGHNVNVLVLDTEVYSNTGGQSSKSTPLAAVARFSAAGKATPKKDLGLMAMSYGNVYVAQIAMGAKDSQTIQALVEAESYPGPSLVIAYSHCIAHGYDLSHGLEQQKRAVQSGYWPIYRYDPRRGDRDMSAFKLDCKPPELPLQAYLENEVRFKSLARSQPERAEALVETAQERITTRFKNFKDLMER